jgi:predicted membrane channel-forming protein YqfA (hemolysin III family)
MNQTLKDKAWKLVEITFYVAVVLLVVVDIDWKSFLAWSLDSALIVAEAVIPLFLLAVLLFVIERNDRASSVSNDDSGHAVRYFLFRSMMIGAAFGIPGVFFPQTRKVLRFLRNLEAVQIATDIFHLVIVFTLLGLILQGLFHVARSALRLLLSQEKS